MIDQVEWFKGTIFRGPDPEECAIPATNQGHSPVPLAKKKRVISTYLTSFLKYSIPCTGIFFAKERKIVHAPTEDGGVCFVFVYASM
jgi:hypothetical protein